MSAPDPNDMLRDDMEKFQRYRGSGGMDKSPGAVIELVLTSLAALAGLLWIIALLWTPDPIPGQTWMGMGMLSLTLLGGPAALVYWLRRGGAEVVMTIIRQWSG